jgi:hypothetical protein
MKKVLTMLLLVAISHYAQSQNQNLLSDTGKVGIGTTTPTAVLTVNGSVSLWSQVRSGEPRPVINAGTATGEIRGMATNYEPGDDGFLRLSGGGGTNALTKSYIDISGYSVLPDMNQNIVLGTRGLERMRILSNGNIGIGTSAPDAKLAVNGDIKARKVKITATEWPDYVFGENYQLMDIMEVADFIDKNKHLPGVPSETDIRRTNEIELGNMNTILLKKIEELTLYIIELKKENIAMKELLDRNNIK